MVDTGRCSCPLHHFRQRIPVKQVWKEGHQPWSTDIARPARSPNLQPLDFYYWAFAQKKVHSAKPTTVDKLINVVNRFSEEHRENVLHSVALNVLKRGNLCVQQNGGNLKHLL